MQEKKSQHAYNCYLGGQSTHTQASPTHIRIRRYIQTYQTQNTYYNIIIAVCATYL